LTIKGGTNVSKSPVYDAYTRVFLPAIDLMGIKTDIKLNKHGLFPDVVGDITLEIQSLVGKAPLKPIDFTERGSLKKIDVYATYTEGSMEAIYQEEFKESFLELVKSLLPSTELNFIDSSNPIGIPKSSKA